MLSKTKSKELYQEAQQFIPGGVNSAVRAFKSVEGDPVFIKSAKGPYLTDEDGNQYVDLINSWGPMILGHANEIIEKPVKDAISHSLSLGTPTARETEIAKLITAMVPSVEMVRMVNSGTEATMSAVRLARGFTGKNKLIKFEGCYHGHGDAFLIAAGSGAATFGVPNSPGVTPGSIQDTLIAPYNDLNAVENLVNEHGGELAAIIIEPVPGNMGCVLPRDGFLEGLRELCDEHNILLIFDEVMSGFRLAQGGAQEYFGVTPDLTAMGKIIGGGMPVGAFGGRKEIMEYLSPNGPVYQAGTLSGNPVAMAAGIAMLKHLHDHHEIYDQLETIGKRIVQGFRSNMEKLGCNFTINQVGSMFSIFFTEQDVIDFQSAKSSDTALFSKYFNNMLEQGIYLAPSQFESAFISSAISHEIADQVVEANYHALAAILQHS